ncbi:MAG: polysaccharide deacetylase family protein [Rhodospirillales bacterium]|nr:polysaccharide deacetylase family protein [Alphaproteobacteria bacterium]MCB9981855.1 polysaccharide deacetylase family protein [Rhodospirillales bacterium]
MSMRKAYLTIDDSPSPDTEKLVDFLTAHHIPALLFVRGALLEKNPRAIEYAITKGLRIGNHSYAHKPAGDMEPQEWCDDLEKCDHLIEAAYARCGIERPGKYYRFPYIDRGDGRKIEQIDSANVVENNKTSILQQYLHDQGFSQPFADMAPSYPSNAVDCLYTFTARDWMLNDTHRGRQSIKTREDLIARAEQDEKLKAADHPHILLLHDQPGVFEDVCALIDYFCKSGFEFLDF